MQQVSEFQINEPPPLGSPDCQFPELTLPGRCSNVIMYIPRSPDNEVRDGSPLPCCGDVEAAPCVVLQHCIVRSMGHSDQSHLTEQAPAAFSE